MAADHRNRQPIRRPASASRPTRSPRSGRPLRSAGRRCWWCVGEKDEHVDGAVSSAPPAEAGQFSGAQPAHDRRVSEQNSGSAIRAPRRAGRGEDFCARLRGGLRHMVSFGWAAGRDETRCSSARPARAVRLLWIFSHPQPVDDACAGQSGSAGNARNCIPGFPQAVVTSGVCPLLIHRLRMVVHRV